ncbi:enhancer of mRNA-decapping protein 3 [Anopheles darlingi]|uniref:enhancer of mRNA-decapping protein 3 n=1 Tax=Anopheles darlingi TaxID=43151 RepID=UPI0021003131|nr:enhancer of mRNA-decapping protein 3 [Anopheles darlingi]
MAEKWIGKSVSIHCRNDIGIFQGIIKRVTPTDVVITKAVRNGIPLKKSTVEVTLSARDIAKFELIACSNVPSIPTKYTGPSAAESTLEEQFDELSFKSNTRKESTQSQQQQQLQQPQQDTATTSRTTIKASSSSVTVAAVSYGGNGVSTNNNSSNSTTTNTSKVSKHASNNGGKLGGRSRKNLAKESTFGSPDDDPIVMDKDFDFEKNLALFDKQAIWSEIDANQSKAAAEAGGGSGAASGSSKRPQAPSSASKTKYRHDENVLASVPAQYRRIEYLKKAPIVEKTTREYLTDEGLVIPSIPPVLLCYIGFQAVVYGYDRHRQNDFLARGATELALQLLGGSRRLTPNNQHQWPKIVIIIDEAKHGTYLSVDNLLKDFIGEDVFDKPPPGAPFRPYFERYPEEERLSDVGFCTARLLASHGLETMVCYLTHDMGNTKETIDRRLYRLTGNGFTSDVESLPSCDLVIMASTNGKPSPALRKFVSDSRAPVLAINPPQDGFEGIPIKCSIVPILPLSGTREDAVGRLYLCNIGIPNKVFEDCSFRYASPFDKFVIPIHRRKDD